MIRSHLVLGLVCTLANGLFAQGSGSVEPAHVRLGPAEVHAGRTVDVPPPPRAVQAMRTLPGHGLPPVPPGIDTMPAPRSLPMSDPRDPAPSSCSITHFVNRAVTPNGAMRSTIGEPSAACNRDTCFMTGNWYAALSTDAGMSWTHIDPSTRFPAIDGGFCCDQRALYIPSRDITVWYLQYSFSQTTQRGSGRIAVSVGRDNLRDNIWHSWVWNPQHFGRPAGEWFDFPDLAFGDDNLYVASNVFDAAQNLTDAVVYRLNLDQLRAGGGLSASFWTRNSAAAIGGGPAYRLTQGATGTMYWASHQTTSLIRVFRSVGSGGASWNDRPIADWNGVGTYTATAPNGVNWAGRMDGRIASGYAKGGEYGFLWTAPAGSGRPHPYIRVSRFRTNDHTLIADEDMFFGSELAAMYPAAASNSAGEVGVVFAFGQADGNASGWNPTTATKIALAPCQTGFGGGTVAVPFSGSSSPTRAGWGDYFSVQRHNTFPDTFVATGMTQRSGSGNQNQEPRYLWFGQTQTPPTTVNLFVEDNLSLPDVRVPITVAETDLDGLKDGLTSMTRRFMAQQRYTLTAPASMQSGSNTYLFNRWRYRPTVSQTWNDRPVGERVLAVDSIGTSSHVAEARYVLQVSFDVASRNPSSGVPITVSVTDIDGLRNGTTTFTRRYRGGTSVDFTAPAQAGIAPFKRWWISNIAQPLGQRTISVLPLTASTTVEVEYYERVVGESVPYGRGCAGSNGLEPKHTAASPTEGGATVPFEVTDVPTKTPVALYLGFSNQEWDGIRLPLSLGFIGADPKCEILAAGFLVVPSTSDAGGRGASINVPITKDASAVGVHFYTQFVVVDLGVSAPLKITVSNGLDSTIGGIR